MKEQVGRIGRTLDSAKEKIGWAARYLNLATKNAFGKADEKEFDELLSMDFEMIQKSLPEVPPFDPHEELAKIRQMPKEEKKAALEEYKTKLAHQREALAKCRVFVERMIEFNNDAPQEKLFTIVDIFGDRYGFSASQKRIMDKVIGTYYVEREKVLEMRSQISDDRALVREINGIEMDEKTPLTVGTGPMSIDIHTDSATTDKMKDLAWEPSDIKNVLGFQSKSRGNDKTIYTVMNTEQPSQAHRTLIHEREHAKNEIFRHMFDKNLDGPHLDELMSQYENETDVDTKITLLESWMRAMRDDALNAAKDEIVAMKKDLVSVNFAVFFDHSKNNPYDYLAGIRNKKVATDQRLWKELGDRVLIREYKEIVDAAVRAFDTLRGTYTVDETIALLTDKTLSEWPKTAKRLLEQKKKHA